MKLLVYGIDAADPKILFDHEDEFPSFARLSQSGSRGTLQGYCFGYGSYDNWATFYTGLPPREHGVIRRTGESPDCPTIDDITPHAPLWEVLNRHGYSTAFMRGLMMNPAPEVDGWVAGGDPEFLEKTASTRYPVFCERDAHLADLLQGEIPDPARPKWLEALGSDWDEAIADPSVLERVVPDSYFASFLEFVRAEAEYNARNAVRLQRAQPTDFLYFYLSSIDILQHFQFHEKGWDTVRRGYKIIDDALGMLLDELEPDNVMMLSDHGQEPFGMMFPETPVDVQREAFGWPVKAWREDGTILCRGSTGVLSACHSMDGVIFCSGVDFARGAEIGGYRMLDTYPTVLRLFDIECDRDGTVIPAFRDAAKNQSPPLPEPEFARIVVVQTLAVNTTLGSVNELWIRYRGAHISVAGQERFRHTFLHDPRVDAFVNLGDCLVEWDSFNPGRAGDLRRRLADYDLVVVPLADGSAVRELWL